MASRWRSGRAPSISARSAAISSSGSRRGRSPKSSSLLSVKLSINKTYVKDNADESADWFEQYGIRVTSHDSASVNPAPKPKTAAAKKSKPAAPEQLTKEAA